MAQLFDNEWKREDLLRRTGRLSQLCGVRMYEFMDGKEKGSRAADVRTGSGLIFTLLLDRAMDIGPAEFAGCPLAWHSCTGFPHPSYFIPFRDCWLGTFGGGLVTTCGLSNVGTYNVDTGKEFGLHGVITSSPAENVKIDYKWNGDDLDICVEGTVREAAVFGPNLALHRLIWTRLGEKKIFIEDRITNEGYQESPVMFLYHINIGWPILDKDTIFITPSKKVTPLNAEAEKEKDDYPFFDFPQKEFREKVYHHDMIPDPSGNVQLAVVNPSLHSPCFGIYLKYPYRELPRFTQWKMIGEGTYVLGLEPGNSSVMGRSRERAEGTLQYLDPGESRSFHLEIGVISSQEEMNQISDLVDNLLRG